MDDFPPELDDQAAAAALAGDAEAFSPIVAAYERRVFAFLGRMGFDAATAEDLAQDTFLRLWRFRDRFDHRRGSVAAWVFGIARNVALTEFRRAGRRPTDSATDDAFASMSSADETSASAELDERREHLRLALRRLSDSDRIAIAISYVDGLPAPEAAALVGCLPDAYRTRLSRARRRLAAFLENTA